MMRRACFVIATIALAGALPLGCTRFPTLDAQVTAQARAADFPSLLPLDHLLEGTQTHAISPATVTQMAARIRHLNALASARRTPVIDAATRARLAAAVAHHS